MAKVAETITQNHLHSFLESTEGKALLKTHKLKRSRSLYKKWDEQKGLPIELCERGLRHMDLPYGKIKISGKELHVFHGFPETEGVDTQMVHGQLDRFAKAFAERFNLKIKHFKKN